MELKINPEFKKLIPPLTVEEFAQLEANILQEGIRDDLITWKGVLVDGHNRYEIATKHELLFATTEMHFESEEEAKVWMIKNQFGRRNLPAYERAKLALELKSVFAEQAKKNKSLAGGDKKTHGVKSPEAITPLRTSVELGKIAGVGEQTIKRVAKIEAKAPPEIKEQLRRQEISINKAYKAIMKPHVSNNSGENEWYTPGYILDSVFECFGGYPDLDPASCEAANEKVKAKKIFTKENSGLEKEWFGHVFINPPYAQPLMSEFAEKIVSSREEYDSCIVLVNNATETIWFQKILSVCSAVCFPKSRIKFWNPRNNKAAPLQGQSLIYIGVDPTSFVNAFSKIGFCLYA